MSGAHARGMAAAAALATCAAPAQAQGWSARDSYPEEALRLRQEGRVVIRLVISPAGAVTSCSVTESSGAPSLDADACEKALKRVRFKPARDEAGNPIASTYTLPMRYVLPKP